MQYIHKSDLTFMDPIDKACVLASADWDILDVPRGRFSDVRGFCPGQDVTELPIKRLCGHALDFWVAEGKWPEFLWTGNFCQCDEDVDF